jgi:hypothetical protein
MTDIVSNRFAIVPIYADSTGRETTPGNAVFVGSRSAVMERILDSRERRICLNLVNDAAHAKDTLKSIRAREDSVATREQAVQAREDALNSSLLADTIAKLDALAARMDAIEEELAHDPEDDELPLPPGASADPTLLPDDGELEALRGPTDPDVPAAIEDERSENDNEGDLPTELTEKIPTVTGTAPEFDPDKPRERTARNVVGVSLW